MVDNTPALFLRERFAHMGVHSGYDQLFVHLEEHLPRTSNAWHRPVRFRRKKSWLKRGLGKIKKRYAGISTPFYLESGMAAELELIWKARRQKGKLLHVAFLENSYGLLRSERIRDFLGEPKVVATVHQPASWWKLHARPELVSELDVLIVLSPSEKAFFETILPGRVHFIPHGVDLDFFRPADSADSGTFRCLFAGQWLRDIRTLISVVEKVLAIRPDIHFDLLYPRRHRRRNPDLIRIARHPQVHWRHGLNDTELRTLYQRADVLFLPLLDCTANNALLEGMACGLPIVATDLPAIRSYTNADFAFLFQPWDPSGMVEAIVGLCENEEAQIVAGRAAREHTKQHFGWDHIAKQTLNLYKKLLD